MQVINVAETLHKTVSNGQTLFLGCPIQLLPSRNSNYIIGEKEGAKKKAVGYSFVIKSIISKGSAVKLYTAHERNIFPSFLIENSFYHRIKFHFKVSLNIVQCDINAEALYRQFEKLRVIFLQSSPWYV